MKRESIEDRGRKAARSIEGAWEAMRRLFPELPPAVIVIHGVPTRSRVLGHFAPVCWQFNTDAAAHEVGINPHLFGQPETLIAVLVHEAAHALNHVRKIEDCSGKGRYYHLTTFRDTAREMGLECNFLNRRYGWTATRFPDNGAPAKYRAVLRRLRQTLPLGAQVQRPIVLPTGTRTPSPGHVRLTCACPPEDKRCVYVNKSTAEVGAIRCDRCGELFERAESREPAVAH